MKKSRIKKFAENLSLQDLTGAILAFGLILLSSIWLVVFNKIESERNIEISNKETQTANLARAFEEHTLRTLENADQKVLFLKYQYEREGKNLNSLQYMDDDQLAHQPFILMGVIDENGNFIASTQTYFIPSKLNDREHFFVHKEFDRHQLYVSKPVLGRSSQRWSIQMTRRINQPDGSFGGVVVISVDPFYFTEFYKKMSLGANSAISLIGQDGVVRARQSGENSELGQDLAGSRIFRELAINPTAGHFIAKSPIDGIERIYSYRALSHYPLIVLVGVDLAEALREFNQRVIGYCWVTGIGSGMIILFLILLLQMIKYQKRDKEILESAYQDREEEVRLRTREVFLANKELASANQGLRQANEALETQSEKIKQIAYSDALTGLPNRLHFNERIEAEMGRAQRGEASGSVLFIDLDDFKTINDVFGHSQGDALITMMGKRVLSEAGKDAFVARIGGDEFVVILPGISERSRIADIANRILKEICVEYELEGTVFIASASIGIAIYPSDGDTTDKILKNADNAMYAAKKSDKNCWRFYEASLQAEALERVVLRSSLTYAVGRGELSLQYQPLTRAQDSVIVGFEALLRWNSPEHGQVSPARFIPLAEQSGLIHQIGRWVLDEACAFVKKLALNGYNDVYVAVNISAKQIASDEFVAVVRSAIEGAKINPEQIELEITESYLMISIDDAVRKFRELRAMGIHLSLDDFGTGFSSLTYLWNLPVHTLKIDKSFIDMIMQDPSKVNIISSIIKMAHDLNMIVVAEGVEYQEQYCYLVEHACDLIQGYYISRPVDEQEAIQLLENKPLPPKTQVL